MSTHPETWNSYEWAKKLKVFNIGTFKPEKELKIDECLILDPDGWDRKDLDNSYLENITRKEFLCRVLSSTIIPGAEWGKSEWEEKIKYYKYYPHGGNSCTDTLDGFLAYLDTMSEGETITVEPVLMFEDDFKKLPEFTGF